MAVSKQQPLSHYQWGNQCDGWNLVDSEALSIKQERMPAGTAEQLHRHERANQFFFILKGTATFEIDGTTIRLEEQEGIEIKSGSAHRIMNDTATDLELILVSQPSTQNDRTNLST